MHQRSQNGRAVYFAGYIGIHETINALSGNQHMYDSDALREKRRRHRPTSARRRRPLERRDRLRLQPVQHAERKPLRPFSPLDTAEFGVIEGDR